MTKIKKLLIILIFVLFILTFFFFLSFSFGRFFKDEHDAYSFRQANELIETKTLMDKTYEECLDILILHGIDVKSETVEFKGEKRQINVLGKEIIVFMKINYDVGWANDPNVQRHRQFFLNIYFDENMKVIFVDISPNIKGG